MSKRKWHSGPTPHVGWWLSSKYGNVWLWRWWDGASWSLGAVEQFDAEYAAVRALIKNERSHAVIWTAYYPENARVPRVDPKATP